MGAAFVTPVIGFIPAYNTSVNITVAFTAQVNIINQFRLNRYMLNNFCIFQFRKSFAAGNIQFLPYLFLKALLPAKALFQKHIRKYGNYQAANRYFYGSSFKTPCSLSVTVAAYAVAVKQSTINNSKKLSNFHISHQLTMYNNFQPACIWAE